MSDASGIILVVDDEAEVRGMLADYVEVRGYNVLTAADASEALRALVHHPEIELLLTDVVMPGSMNGFDLARQAERMRPGIRVVIMTGHEAGAMIGQAMKRPPVILQKPFRFEHLIQILAATFAADAA